jgi:hypothetical protein
MEIESGTTILPYHHNPENISTILLFNYFNVKYKIHRAGKLFDASAKGICGARVVKLPSEGARLNPMYLPKVGAGSLKRKHP